MKLTTLLERDWIEADEMAEAVTALEGGADDPLVIDVWVHLSKWVSIRPELFGALCSTPPSVLREVARRWCTSDDTTVLVYAAAIELGGAPALRRVKGALERLLLVTFESFEALHHKLAGLTSDGLLVRAATRALQRLRPLSTEVLTGAEQRTAFGTLLGLFSVVTLADQDEAALANVLSAVEPELRAAHLQPRLDVAKKVLTPRAAEPPTFLEAPLSEDDLKSLQLPRLVHAEMNENLRLAVLQAAVHAGRVELPEVEPEDFDASEEEEDARNARVRAQLLAIEVPEDFRQTLRELNWEAAEDVQPLIFPAWSGEEGVFDIDHLFCIEELPVLEVLHLGMPTETPEPDLSPLCGLKHLKRLTWWAHIGTLAPLLGVPSLEHATLRYDDTDENREVAEQLRARGVILERW